MSQPISLGRAWTIAALLALTAGPTAGRASDGTPAGIEFFEKKIRPLLVANCHQCHGGDKKRGNLHLDNRAGLLQGGDSGPAVVPGQPDQSLLLKAVRYTDDDLRMPPKGKLPDEHIADLTAWVRMGAPWPAQASHAGRTGPETFDLQERSRHWSFQPLRPVTPPAVRRSGWPQSPVDVFVLAQLEAAGLSPARPADKRTLLRRVTYDLTGLPPTPADLDAFLVDESPDAYGKVVERLLASPHYGERWARHWLDLVRFAETCGHEFDFDLPEAYEYRDYVIRALNADIPYDQLVLEHVAGDLLPNPRRHPTQGFNESILGTGFWFLGEAKHSPVDIRGDEVERLDNQIDVLTKTFLGLTVACARCHDHKFDAISTRDYYALVGYLESSRYQRAFLDAPERVQASLRPLRELRARARPLALSQTAEALRERLEPLRAVSAPDRWRKVFPQGDWGRVSHPLHPWSVLATPDAPLSPQQFGARRQELAQRLNDSLSEAAANEGRHVLFEDFRRAGYPDWFVTGAAFGNGPPLAPQVVLQADPHRPVSGLVGPAGAHSGLLSNRLQGVLRSRTFRITTNKILYHVAGRKSQINLIIDGYQLIRNPIYGGLTVPVDHGDRPQWRVQDVSMWRGHRAYIELIDDGPGYLAVDQILFADADPPTEPANRLIARLLEDPQLNTPEALAQKYQELLVEIVEEWRAGRLDAAADRDDRAALLDGLLRGDLLSSTDGSPGPPEPDQGQLAALFEQIRQVEADLPTPRRAMAMADGTAWNERVHIRGNHKNLGEEVPRRFLEVLAGREQPAPAQGSGRLELARRMLQPSNPLLPRVLVNRLWQHHFGEGIVRSPDNFGVLGERPTHPELLDYLAAEFVRQGWSIKPMHRLMVLSSTYQMSSRPDDSLAEQRDPENKLLHRMPLRRLEAETIRDALLAVSGRLDRTMYGPGVLPYLTPHMAGRGRPTTSGPLDGNGRRSLYLNVRRNFLTPLFLAFDYPLPFTTMGRRSVSNVPAQALTLMNNPLVVQQAENWARRALNQPGLSTAQRLTILYEEAFGRPPTATELSEAAAFLHEQGKGEDGAPDVGAWSDLCHVLLNVKEFLFID
jgi:hypothetical protein